MAQLITLPTMTDPRGSLTVIEKVLPFAIERVFFIHDVHGARGGHRHKKCRMAMVALSGGVEVFVQNLSSEQKFQLTHPGQCLLLEPEDWHSMDHFDRSTSLVVLASMGYDKDDYIYERYR